VRTHPSVRADGFLLRPQGKRGRGRKGHMYSNFHPKTSVMTFLLEPHCQVSTIFRQSCSDRQQIINVQIELNFIEIVSESGVSAIKLLKRPNCLVYVRGALILRWENKVDAGEVAFAQEENASKLKVWSSLYYSELPYVIGVCCSGGLFQWLKLSPSGEDILAEPISKLYDLTFADGCCPPPT
jgi:hypothetical protein